jgi:steroid 5-alpha reductase family enzyme
MNKIKLLALTAISMVSVQASAAVPAALTAAMAEINTDAGSVVDAGWPIFLTIIGGLVLMGVAKKAIGKAT